MVHLFSTLKIANASFTLSKTLGAKPHHPCGLLNNLRSSVCNSARLCAECGSVPPMAFVGVVLCSCLIHAKTTRMIAGLSTLYTASEVYLESVALYCHPQLSSIRVLGDCVDFIDYVLSGKLKKHRVSAG